MQENAAPVLVDEAGACRRIGGENTPIHRSTLWRGIRAGRYPQPLKRGTRINRWSVDDIDAALTPQPEPIDPR